MNPLNFRYPRRDDIFVSVAGVTANLATAAAVALVMRLALVAGFDPMASASRPALALWAMGLILCEISIGLMLFNLIPVPPLDGSHVLRNLLSSDAAHAYERVGFIARFVFLVLIFTHVVGRFLWPPVDYLVGVLLGPAQWPTLEIIVRFLLGIGQ
jgi:Zn-dependent protease